MLIYQHLSSLKEANKYVQDRLRKIRNKMMLTEHKTMQVGFDIKDRNRVLQAEQTKLKGAEAVLAQTKLDFEEVQRRRRVVQAEIRVELERAENEKEIRKQNYFAKTKQMVMKDVLKFKLTNEIYLLQTKLKEKSQLLATITPVVEHLNGINISFFNLKKRKQKKELKCIQQRLTKDVVLLEKAVELLQEHFV